MAVVPALSFCLPCTLCNPHTTGMGRRAPRTAGSLRPKGAQRLSKAGNLFENTWPTLAKHQQKLCLPARSRSLTSSPARGSRSVGQPKPQ